MPTTKYYIEFRENPEIGDFFEYELRDSLGLIPYENTETKMRMNFGSGNVMPNQSAVLSTLDLTLNNLLTQLNMGWEANYTNGLAQTTNISYARVGNSIEITIVHSAAHILQKVYMNERFFMRTETPCETFVHQTGRPIYGFNDFYTNEQIESLYASGLLFNLVKDQTLNINLVTGTVSNFHQVFRRGNTIQINQSAPTSEVRILRVYASQDYAPYFTENTLFVPFFPNFLMPENSLEFSIDGLTWQTSNTFEDLEEGNYTVLVRDAFGCVKTYEIENTGQSNIPTVPNNIYISESNSLRFALRNNGLKNIFNTLSCEENENTIYPFVHKFLNNDVVQTEIRSSYQDLEATHGTIEKVIANIGITDSRDALFFNQNGFIAVLFESGNIYTDGVESGTYSLNGALPEWGIVGNWVNTPYGLLQIQEIAFLDNGSEVLILNSTFAIVAPTTQTITCTYNREIYDIFIHTLDLSEYENSIFQVGIFNETQTFYLSEKIRSFATFESNLMKWRNSKNTDIYYSLGTQMFAWIDEVRIVQISDGEVEILKTDSRVFSINATDYKAVEITIDLLTSGIARKLKVALKHDTLEINGLFYKLAENPEIENLGSSNLYRLTAKLIESGEPFTSLGVTNPFNGDVLRLLEVTNEKYIKI